MHDTPLFNLAPALPLLGLAALLALGPLAWVGLRWRRHGSRRAALTTLALFLTFDLIVFGAFTRLSDSGLGCPDWPGCYGQASPLGAQAQITAAQQALPDGPVTWRKAWIEMIHRYLAMTVGALILVLAAAAWAGRRHDRHRAAAAALSPWWPTATLAWVVVQGLFGKFTVTLKLYPAVVTLHLLGGLLLLALLTVQQAAWRSGAGRPPLPMAPSLRRLAAAALVLLALQVTLGGWVSTNYAVLACSGFPDCNGQWWPAMQWAEGFAPLRELGHSADGRLLELEALVAIHMAHRLMAGVVAATLLGLAWRLWRSACAVQRRFGAMLAALLLAQVASGLGNVVLGWPLAAALAHSAGAAALVWLLTLLLARARPAAAAAAATGAAARPGPRATTPVRA